MQLTVILNGQSRTFASLPDVPSLADLIENLGLNRDRVAVEHNGEIPSRESWKQVPLTEGDKLEIVHFVGGGTNTLGIYP